MLLKYNYHKDHRVHREREKEGKGEDKGQVFPWGPFQVGGFILSTCLLLTSQIMAAGSALDVLPEKLQERVQNHLILGDWSEAISEARAGTQTFPGHEGLHREYVKAVSKGADLPQAMKVWREHVARFGMDEGLLEELSFCALEHAMGSHSLQTRLFGLIGGAMSQDIRGVHGLSLALEDPNAHLRRVAVDLAPYLPDKGLRRQLMELLKKERQLDMRVAIIKALGAQRAEASRRLLFQLASRSARAEERAAAAESLGRIYEDLPPGDLSVLLSSNRASLRWLGCRLAAHLGLDSLGPELEALREDAQVDVRVAAWEALGRLRQAKGPLPLKEHPRVRLAATWAKVLMGDEGAAVHLLTYLDSRDKALMREAAIRLAACGERGLDYCEEGLRSSLDPLVIINLSLALIRHDRIPAQAAKALFEALESSRERLTWSRGGLMEGVSVQSGGLRPPGAAVAEDHLVRLKLLNLLAMADHQEARERVRYFLGHRRFPLMGEAAMGLLSEGEAVEGIRILLHDEDRQVRLRAGLILALWSRDPEALTVLTEEYPLADRAMKESILEIMGRVGNREVLGFLQTAMEEPFQNLRVMAAAAVVQVLNH